MQATLVKILKDMMMFNNLSACWRANGSKIYCGRRNALENVLLGRNVSAAQAA
ncbi:11610_t:CDS:2 [Funneliformis mosseae]|uniref:11610_t:CDS:1 n=1 Tax=Funneliformis mosseae TaxID=27381 RepID=A0A9N9G0K7_FUNMO|nr:11610_t:CDS:2 [Funneliformis mosseae]